MHIIASLLQHQISRFNSHNTA